ncbi:hypothetical protein F4803DRAFT_451160 [Xylaria telfairii]|nr:hypothetical protein F4803DRAFT_451160 [Xylaria telfairii]
MVVTRRSTRRYGSDELRFTGIDMAVSRSRNKYDYQHSDEDHDLTESDSQATTSNETEDEARAEMENALVQSALARIRKARARGKQDVKLNKGEVAALDRRRKRLEAEAKARDRKRRKDKERRVAVPLSHFDSALGLDDTLSRQPPSSAVPVQGQPSPPIGVFLPPGASQARPRSSTPSSHRSSYQQHGSSSPFDYQYVSPGANKRHVSDTPRPSSSLQNPPPDDDWHTQSVLAQAAIDPFQYQTEGPSIPYPTGAEAYIDPATAGAGHIIVEDHENVLS